MKDIYNAWFRDYDWSGILWQGGIALLLISLILLALSAAWYLFKRSRKL